jgi:MFS family permease
VTSVTSPPATRTWTVGTLVYSTSGVVALFAWLVLGDFAWWTRDRSVTPMAQWYLTQLQVPNLVFALLINSLPAVIQLLITPVISVRSDNYRSRWGRRIPFLLVTTLVATLGMLGLALTPVFSTGLHRLFGGGPDDLRVISIVCFTLSWVVFEVAALASKPIFDGLINDVVPRPLLGRFFGLFRAVGLLDGMIFNYWILGLVPTHFAVIMLSAGMIYGTAFTWVCLRVKEGDYPAPPPAPVRPSLSGNLSAIRRYCRESFTHPYYLSIFVLIMAAGVSFMPFNAFSLPYAHHVGLDMDRYGKAIALVFLISFSLAYPLGWLADRFHPLRMAIVVLGCFIALAIWASLHARTPETFLTALILHGVVSGSYYTAAASSLQQQLFPREKFAQFASAALIFDAIARMFSLPLVGLIIDRTGRAYHFVFVVATVLGVCALGAALFVHAQFRKFGGPSNYVAPEAVRPRPVPAGDATS